MSNQYEGNAGWMRVLFIALFWVAFYLSQFVVLGYLQNLVIAH